MGDGALPRAQLASSAVPTGAQKGSCPCSLDHLDPKVKVVGCALLVLTTIYDNARDHHPCSVCGTYRRVMDTWLWPSKPPHLQVMLMWKGTRNRSVYIRKKAYGLYWHLSLCKLCTEILYLPQSHFFFVYLFLLEKKDQEPYIRRATAYRPLRTGQDAALCVRLARNGWCILVYAWSCSEGISTSRCRIKRRVVIGDNKFVTEEQTKLLVILPL
jgi:hypothetical protein